MSRMKMPPTRNDIIKLVDSCKTPGAKLAVGLAAFSGLHPRQVKGLLFRNLVEFSLAKKQFLEVPSRIQMLEAVGNRRATVVRYYTFLSSRGCDWLREDLRTRHQAFSPDAGVVTAQSFSQADRVVRAAGFHWHDLRDLFHSYCVLANVPHAVVDFMLGYVLSKDDVLDRMSLLREVDYVRMKYAEVEEQFSV